MAYVELHCHSNYSFLEGTSFPHELLTRAKDLGYHALALTDHDNLCGAMEFSSIACSLNIQPIIGAEITLAEGGHLTLLAETRKGYANLCQMLSEARFTTDRREPELDLRLLTKHTEGLIMLTGCAKGPIPMALARRQADQAAQILREYLEWFGPANIYLELQQNLVQGDTQRNAMLCKLADSMKVPVVATNNIHYHIQERHQLQDCLVSIRHRKSLEESHQERRANSEFYLKSADEMRTLFRHRPDAIANTLTIAERCASFDLTTNLAYHFPHVDVPTGSTEETYLHHLCHEAAIRRYGSITAKIQDRLNQEFHLIKKHNLTGFFLLYREIAELAHEVMADLGLTSKEVPLEENPPGRGRGSSVCMLVGYLLGLSHIDPLEFGLSLERFLPEDALASVPDIDLDFPRNIREELIKRVHLKYGWERAALAGMFSTYKLQGAVRDLGLALGLPKDDINRLAQRAEHGRSTNLEEEMKTLPEFRNKLNAPGWKDLIRLAAQLEGCPKYLAQHPGGMVISSAPLTEIVPVQPGAIHNRYIMQWDKNAIDDVGMVKIDFLALGTLSQIQETLALIEKRSGIFLDLSRINFNDTAVYEMLWRGDTIGIFQVESPAQMQTINRIRPANLFDMAHEVAAVRPGVGVNDGIRQYIARRMGKVSWNYDHPLEQGPLERTYGVILFQDQVNQLAIGVAGFTPLEADQLRRAYGRKNNEALLLNYWEKFRCAASLRGVPEKVAHRIFSKLNGLYMFPESHAFAFGVTAYQASWLKHYYPAEFYCGLFNEQPMGFYSPETLKEDAKRHGVDMLLPDVNLSYERCVLEGDSIRLGFRYVDGLGSAKIKSITSARDHNGLFWSISNFMERTRLEQNVLENLVDAGAFDSLQRDRRSTRWEIGLRYRTTNQQIALPLPVEQDNVQLQRLTPWEIMEGEYRTISLHPNSHVMAYIRPHLPNRVLSSETAKVLPEGTKVTICGLVIRRQRPLAKAVFITLEDEFGHIPLTVWPKTYRKYRLQLRERFVMAQGTISRTDGTFSIIVNSASGMSHIVPSVPKSKNWA